MQITIEDLSPVEKRVEFELPWADVAPKLDKAYDALRKDVRLPGFRPGKVPRALLERMYRRQVEDEVARDLVEHSLGQAIQENQLQPVAPPTVDEMEIKAGAPFKFKARVEVRSQVTPKDYAGIPLSRRPPRSRTKRWPRRSRTTGAASPSTNPSRDGRRPRDSDLVLVELSGRVGEHKLKRRQVAIDLENDAEGPLPGLPSRLRGKPIGGDPIEVSYTIPGEGGAASAGAAAELAGRAVHLHVTIKEAREKQVPALDDELAKDTGEAETLEGLRGKLRERLIEADQQRIKREMTKALVKELVKRNEFPIAPALVDRYAQPIVNRAKQQLGMMGIDVDGVDDEEDARGDARRGRGGGQGRHPDPGDCRTRGDHGQRRRYPEAARRDRGGAQRERQAAARRAREEPPHPPDRGPDPRAEDA